MIVAVFSDTEQDPAYSLTCRSAFPAAPAQHANSLPSDFFCRISNQGRWWVALRDEV